MQMWTLPKYGHTTKNSHPSARGLEQTVVVVSNPPSPAVKGGCGERGERAMPMLRELDRLCGRGLEGVSFSGGREGRGTGLVGWVCLGGLGGRAGS